MRKLAIALALVATSACTKSVKQDRSYISELLSHPTGQALLRRASIAPVDMAAPQGASKLIGISPTTADPYLGWVKASVGFTKGEISEDILQTLGPDNNLPYAWQVLKKWSDGSVRIGQIKLPTFLRGMNITAINLVRGKTPYPKFQFHPKVYDLVKANKFTTLSLTTSVNGTPVRCFAANPSANWKVVVSDSSELTIRLRSHCMVDPTGSRHPLSMTTFLSFMSQDAVVRMTFVLGNDTLEDAVGAMNLTTVAIDNGTLPQVQWVNESSYGTKAPILADGQTMAFKAFLTADWAQPMLRVGEPYGFQYWPDAQASKAFGTAPLPPTRVPVSQISAVHNDIDSAASLPDQTDAKSYLGMINQNPPATGAQPDFASTMPLEIQKAHQAYSAKQMASVMLATYRESYRPSFYWQTLEGVEDRANAMNQPNLFFWSGRVHFSWGWNSDQNPLWRTRTQDAGFWPGDFGGWYGMDNQHNGNNHLRYAYELTGDAYLGDVLKYYVSVNIWNYFSDWLPYTEAERAFGRSTKEAIALSELFYDLPESTLLRSRIPQKLEAQRNGVSQVLGWSGHMANNLFDGCDGRVNNAVWCGLQTQTGRGPFVVVAWQTGFVQEVQSMIDNPDLRYLAAAEEYFLQDGTPKTYYPVIDPTNNITGGIGVEWWSPWVALAQKYPQAPGASFILEKVKPVLDDRFQHGCGFPSPYFCLNDSFLSYRP